MKKLLLLLNIFYAAAFAQVPQLLKDILPGNPINAGTASGIGPKGLVKFNNQFYFFAPDTTIQSGIFWVEKEYNLWKSDGTNLGTQKVKDLNSTGNDECLLGSWGNKITPLTIFDNQFFFSATDGTTFPTAGTKESQLCISDGTTSGTVLYKDLHNGPISNVSFQPNSFMRFDEKTFFKGNCVVFQDPGYRYWEYDSITKATKVLGENYVYYDPAGSYWDQRFEPYKLTNNYTIFPVPDYIINPVFGQTVIANNSALLVYNKQLNKLERLKDSCQVIANIGFVNTNQLVIALIPNVYNLNTPIQLFTLDKNTLQLNPYFSFANYNLSTINFLMDIGITFIGTLNNKLYFIKNSVVPSERGLWVTDGTTTGTSQVKSIQHDDMIPQSKIMNNEIYFSSSNYWNSVDTLWKTDGTNAGTKSIAEFYGRSLKISNSVVFDNKLYFSAANNANSGLNEELWETDGTAAGTKMYYDLLPGTQGSIPEDLLVFNNKLFFSAYTPATGREIFFINSTSSAIAENSNNNLKVNLFPNPSTNFVIIEINTDNSINGNLKIINTIGQIVHVSNIHSSKINVDVSSLNSGIYNVIIENDNHSLSKKLQIIK